MDFHRYHTASASIGCPNQKKPAPSSLAARDIASYENPDDGNGSASSVVLFRFADALTALSPHVLLRRAESWLLALITALLRRAESWLLAFITALLRRAESWLLAFYHRTVAPC